MPTRNVPVTVPPTVSVAMVPVIAPDVTVWETLTAYVPTPPGVPVSCDVIMVPAANAGVPPVRTMPGTKPVVVTVVTVNT
jgi:hypothetical protein